jgi:hypothetical protein
MKESGPPERSSATAGPLFVSINLLPSATRMSARPSGVS